MEPDSRQLSALRQLVIAGVLLSCWAFADQTSAGEPGTANAVSTQSGSFVSPLQFFVDVVVSPIGTRVSQYATSRPLSLPNHPRVARSYGPLRQLRLAGGDQILAEVRQWSDDSVELRLKDGQTAIVPQTAIESMFVAGGEGEILDEQFETERTLQYHTPESIRQKLIFDTEYAASGHRSLRLDQASPSVSVDIPIRSPATRIQFWFRAEGTSSPKTSGRVAFEFDEPSKPDPIVVELASSRVAVVPHRLISSGSINQPIGLRSGWHCLTAVFSSQRTLLVVDDILVASARGLSVPLKVVHFTTEGHLWIDSLLMSRLEIPRSPHPTMPSVENDLVVTHVGDEYFGRIQRIAPLGVAFHGVGGDLTLPWSQVAGIQFDRSARPLHSWTATGDGLVARIELQPVVDRPRLPNEHLTGTLVQIDHESMLLLHPWLGELPILWRGVGRIEPLYFGRAILIEPRHFHLGDSIRPEFVRPLPDGTDWASEFELATIPLGKVWLSLNVTDLEPSGPQTPPGSPFLWQLREGRLRTDVFVNGVLAGDLNSCIRFRSSADNPGRLRYEVPSRLLRVGNNSIRFQQRPLTDKGRDYDDWEFSTVRLELPMP